jgi:hypothetical protein
MFCTQVLVYKFSSVGCLTRLSLIVRLFLVIFCTQNSGIFPQGLHVSDLVFQCKSIFIRGGVICVINLKMVSLLITSALTNLNNEDWNTMICKD